MQGDDRAGEGAMISILNQERLLGAALGCISTGFVVLEQRKDIYESIRGNRGQAVTHSQKKEPIFGKKSRLEVAHLWNTTVDQTFGPVIAALSSRGW